MQWLDLLSYYFGGVFMARHVGRFHGGNTSLPS